MVRAGNLAAIWRLRQTIPATVTADDEVIAVGFKLNANSAPPSTLKSTNKPPRIYGMQLLEKLAHTSRCCDIFHELTSAV